MRRLTILSFLLSTSIGLFAQKHSPEIKPSDAEKLSILEDTLALIAHQAVEDSTPEVRLEANKRLIPLLKKALSFKGSFNYAFDKLQNIAISYPADKSFRILTWQLYKDSTEYKYFGFIQMNNPKSTIYPLMDAYKDIQNPEKQVLTSDKWYGSVYYNIKQFKSIDGIKYLLFGYNTNNWIERIKVCDVVSFKYGKPTFGAPVFNLAEKGRAKTVNRIIINYGAESTTRLNFDDELGIIVTDHLEPVQSRNPDLGEVMVPDGTYEAYKLDKGVWKHVDQLPTTAMDEAPRPKPLTGKRTRATNAKATAKDFDWPDEVKKKE